MLNCNYCIDIGIALEHEVAVGTVSSLITYIDAVLRTVILSDDNGVLGLCKTIVSKIILGAVSYITVCHEIGQNVGP